MAENIPSQLMITDVSITNYHRTYSTESMSGIRYRRDSGVQWFKGKVTLQAYGYKNVKLLNGFLASLRGKLNEFVLPLGGAYASPEILVNPTLNTEHGIGSSSINIFHTAGDITPGSVFTLSNDPKLYVLGEEVTGSGTYDITPALRMQHNHLEEINFMAPVITAILDSNETTIEHQGNGMIARATLSWTESLV